MRACVVGVFGSVIVALPLLGRLLAMVVGKVLPPSVERRMFTSDVLMGAALVPAAFQVTVWVVPPETVTS